MLLNLTLTLLLSVQGPGDTIDYSKYEDTDVAVLRDVVLFEYPVLNGEDSSSFSNSQMDIIRNDTADLVINTPRELSQLIKLYELEASSKKELDGWRVQIFSGSNLKEAEEYRSSFLGLYEDIPSYQKWIRPMFRIRVGDFIDRNTAQAFCNKIREHFPGAFVVHDKVQKPRSIREFKQKQREYEKQLEDEYMYPDSNSTEYFDTR